MAFALKGAGSASTDWSVTANQSSFVLTTSTTAGAANDLAVLLYAVDNNATVDGDEVAVTGVTDSAGNFWQKAVEFTNGQGTAQTGATNGIWYCNLQNALAIGATITLAFSNNTSRDAAAVSLTYFTKAAGFKAAVEATNTLANDAANAGSLDATTANIACLRIRAIASETSVATAITKTAAFTAVLTQAVSTGGAATGNQGVRGEYLISTATGAASAPTGGAGAVDHASVYAAFREDAFFVGDPPHNSDQVAGAKVATIVGKAVTAALIAASAGLFQTPYPRGNDPALTAGVPVSTGGAAPRARKVYYQAAFITPYAAPAAAVTPAPQGWQAPLSGAPAVTKAQPGFASVPFNTAQLSVNFTNFGWHGPTATAAPVARAQVGNSFVPYNTVQTQYAANYTNLGWHRPLSPAPAVAQAKQGDSFVPFNTVQIAAVAYSTVTAIPIDAGGAAPRARQVYYQSRFETPPSVVAAYTNFWLQPLSIAASVTKAQPGFASVPFNTAQLSVNFTPFGWHQALSVAPAVAKAQVGFATVPYNTAQLSVNFANFGWHPPPPPAAPVARAQPGSAFVPFNTVQTQYAANYTNLGWYAPLAGAPAVAKARQGDSFVPFNTAQTAAVAYSTATAIPLEMGGAGPRLRQTYYQSRFETLAPAADTIIGVPLDIGGVAPSYRTVFHQSLFEAPFQLPPAPQGWCVPLSVPAKVAKAQVGFGFTVPFNTTQVIVAYSTATGISLEMGGAAPRVRTTYYQARFETPYVAPVAVIGIPLIGSGAPAVAKAWQGHAFVPYNTAQRGPAGIAGIAWFTPLWTVPTRNLTAPQGNSFVPFNTAQIIVTNPGQRRPTLFIANLGRLMNH